MFFCWYCSEKHQQDKVTPITYLHLSKQKQLEHPYLIPKMHVFKNLTAFSKKNKPLLFLKTKLDFLGKLIFRSQMVTLLPIVILLLLLLLLFLSKMLSNLIVSLPCKGGWGINKVFVNKHSLKKVESTSYLCHLISPRL